MEAFIPILILIIAFVMAMGTTTGLSPTEKQAFAREQQIQYRANGQDFEGLVEGKNLMSHHLEEKSKTLSQENEPLKKGDEVEVFTLHNDFSGLDDSEKEYEKTTEGVVYTEPGTRRVRVKTPMGILRRSKSQLVKK